jgi:hypothetical protein
MQVTGRSSFVERIIGAARLDARIYEEVEHDRDATMQAAQVVVLSSAAAGVAALFAIGFGGLIFVSLFGLISWAIYAYVTYIVGTRLLAGPDTRADWGEVARTLGFANSPGLLAIVGVLPALALLAGALISIWILVTTVVALRAALDFSTGRAIATAVLGWLALGVIRGVIFAALAA